MASSPGFGCRYCPRCRGIVTTCPCTRLYQGVYNPELGIHTLLDIDIEAARADSVGDAETHARNDLDVTAPTCQKGGQHGDFIASDRFIIDHLPPELRHPAFYVWLRNCIPSIVRVVSSNGLASGRATVIPEEINMTMPCQNPECPYRRYGPHDLYGGIGIITNNHVVRSKEDAMNTTVEFFYTDYQSRNFTVHKETGNDIHFTNNHLDYTVLSCFVHSDDLLTIVVTCDKIKNNAWKNIPPHVKESSKNFAIIISHPHGTPKKISIGNVIKREKIIAQNEVHQENVNILRDIYNLLEKNSALRRFSGYIRQLPDINLSRSITWYTTATCQGSSGAPVFMGNVVTENDVEFNQAHTHRGVDREIGFNCCYT